MEGGYYRLHIYTVLILASMLLFYYSDALAHVPIELVYPGFILYHILTFSMTYPKAHPARKFIVCFFITFSDLFVSMVVLQQEPPPILKVLIPQYIVLYLVVYKLTMRELYIEFGNNYYRSAIFLLAAYVKSTSLVSTLQSLIVEQGFNQITFLIGLGIGIMKLCSVPIVYILDSFFCVKITLKNISISELVVMMKNGAFLSSLILAYFGAQGMEECDSEYRREFYYCALTTIPKTFANMYFLIWYTVDNIDYSSYFTKEM
jgi:hypothetical protein